MESKRVLFLFALLILGLVAETTSAARLIGGYEPIKDVKNPHVVEIAKFAVTEHNKKASDNLAFVKVVSGEEQVVAGTNYKLSINAIVPHTRCGNGDVYEAVVYVNLEKHRSLTSFKRVEKANLDFDCSDSIINL